MCSDCQGGDNNNYVVVIVKGAMPSAYGIVTLLTLTLTFASGKVFTANNGSRDAINVTSIGSSTSNGEVTSLGGPASDDILSSRGGSGSLKCPKICRCTKNFTIVNCDRKSLTEVPQDIPKSAVSLILSHNVFGQMMDDFFPNLPNLTDLHLDVSKITGVSAHAFRGLPNLRQLFLFSNQIQILHEKEFCEDLPVIQSVFLDRNNLENLPNFGNCSQLKTITLENNEIHSMKFPDEYSKLKNLEHLTLSLNPVEFMYKNDFLSLKNSNLSRLLLSRISLKSVEKGTFDPIAKTLGSLRLSYNSLNSSQLSPIFHELSKCTKLLSLDLDGLKFNSHLPANLFEPFRNLSLTSLSLANNQIATIQSGTFSPMIKLIHLSLEGSKITLIEPTAFQGLNGLQHIDLSRNNLEEIPANLPASLTDINFSNNHISTIRDNEMAKLSNLKKLNLHKNLIQQLRNQAFGGLKRLERLDLSSNIIDHIPKETLSPLRHLQWLNLSDNRLVNIIKNVHVFEQLKRLKELDLSSNDCLNLPFTVFNNLTGLRFLHLNKNQLGSMLARDEYGGTFQGLDNLVTLNLQENDISELSPVIFRHLINVKRLDLSHNRLAHWSKELFTFSQQIQQLDLSHNKITVIDKYALGKNYSNFKTLNLEDNPFACTCELVWFCGWANGTKVKLIDFNNYTCDSPKFRQGVKLVNFDWRGLSCYDWYPLIISLSVLLGIFVLTIIIVCLYRCRWRIKLCCYHTSQKCSAARSDYQILNEDLQFDAYISFDKNDLNFVNEVIMTQFDARENETENRQGRYQLCFEPEDFPMGKNIIPSMCQCVEKSRRAIIVITNSYLSSGRFQMELDHLHHEGMERSFGLIFVTTGPSLKLRLLPKWLHKHYQNGKFLEWTEDEHAKEVFREKLDKQLRALPADRDERLLESV